MINILRAKKNQANNSQDIMTLMQKQREAAIAVERYKTAVEQYKKENPDVDVEDILSKQEEYIPAFEQLKNSELAKFVAYAKEQGIRMSFDAMERGVLDAGRKDMQNSLTEITDSLKFDRPVCPECNKEMENRGKSKKK